MSASIQDRARCTVISYFLSSFLTLFIVLIKSITATCLAKLFILLAWTKIYVEWNCKSTLTYFKQSAFPTVNSYDHIFRSYYYNFKNAWQLCLILLYMHYTYAHIHKAFVHSLDIKTFKRISKQTKSFLGKENWKYRNNTLIYNKKTAFWACTNLK